MTDERPESRMGVDAGSSIRAVQDLYDRWAGMYDWNPALAMVRPARRRAIDRLALSDGDTVIDMGTGTGANLGLLSDAVGERGTVVGVDVSPGMLARARRRVEAHGWDNVALLRADIRDPPIDGPVDAVVSSFVVVMYRDPDRLIDAWLEGLGPARVANLYAGPSDRWFAPAVNGLLGLYLRAFERGWRPDDGAPGPLEVIGRRGHRARRALADRSTAFESESLVLGLAKLDVGRVAAATD